MIFQSASTATALPARPSLFAEYLARDRAFKYIGAARANALLEALGSDLREAILSLDDRVVDIIGEAPAINAAAVLETRLPETEFLAWLASVGADIPIYKAIRIARAWGKQGAEAVKQNPYLLLAVSDWKTADRIAASVGISKQDPRRQIAAVEAALMGKGGLDSGSTLMSLEHALRRAQRLSGHSIDPGIVDRAVDAGAAVRLSGALQPPGAAHMEAGCALLLAKFAPQAPCSGVTDADKLESLVEGYEAGQPFPLTEAQREAVRMSHRHRLLVLAGYAGSGKTTVLKGICDTQEAIGKAPLIITLSGRAAQRASEATGRRAITVARFLIEEEKSNGPLGSDRVLIADEASMLGLVELWRILRRLGEASLVLCGDPAQLPPVSPGVVFHHLAVDPDTRKVVLDRVHRQDESSGIPSLAEGVRNGFIGNLPGFTGPMPGVSFQPCDRDVFCDEILRIGKVLSSSGDDRSSVQIIAPTNREIGQINAYFHKRILRKRPNLWPGTRHIAEGEPVIWTQNDPKRGLTNGALGRIIRIDGEVIHAEIDGAKHELQQQDGQFLQLAWAISVHKAQGSQWSRVIIPVYQSMIVDRSLIYTALTRAQEQVIFMGSFSATRRAVERRPTAEMRNCGFATWLKLARRS
ncbi:AAA family ATPase [Limimaricola variabilis]